MTLRTLNYGNYGIFLIMGNAGFCPSTVSNTARELGRRQAVFSYIVQIPYSSPYRPMLVYFLGGEWRSLPDDVTAHITSVLSGVSDPQTLAQSCIL